MGWAKPSTSHPFVVVTVCHLVTLRRPKLGLGRPKALPNSCIIRANKREKYYPIRMILSTKTIFGESKDYAILGLRFCSGFRLFSFNMRPIADVYEILKVSSNGAFYPPGLIKPSIRSSLGKWALVVGSGMALERCYHHAGKCTAYQGGLEKERGRKWSQVVALCQCLQGVLRLVTR